MGLNNDDVFRIFTLLTSCVSVCTGWTASTPQGSLITSGRARLEQPRRLFRFQLPCLLQCLLQSPCRSSRHQAATPFLQRHMGLRPEDPFGGVHSDAPTGSMAGAATPPPTPASSLGGCLDVADDPSPAHIGMGMGTGSALSATRIPTAPLLSPSMALLMELRGRHRELCEEARRIRAHLPQARHSAGHASTPRASSPANVPVDSASGHAAELTGEDEDCGYHSAGPESAEHASMDAAQDAAACMGSEPAGLAQAECRPRMTMDTAAAAAARQPTEQATTDAALASSDSLTSPTSVLPLAVAPPSPHSSPSEPSRDMAALSGPEAAASPIEAAASAAAVPHAASPPLIPSACSQLCILAHAGAPCHRRAGLHQRRG